MAYGDWYEDGSIVDFADEDGEVSQAEVAVSSRQ